MPEIKECAEFASETNHQQPPWMKEPVKTPENRRQIAQKAIEVFLRSKGPGGGIRGIGWWQAANGYTAIALKDLHAGNQRNYATLSEALHQCEERRHGFINEFTDDSLWWALCCIQMYSLSEKKDEWFLQKAKAIWRHLRDSIVPRGQIEFNEQDMEGGCWWKTVPAGNQISAISSGLYAECSLRLALVEKAKSHMPNATGYDAKGDETSVEEYVEAARKTLGWLLRVRYRPKQGMILSGINIELQKAIDWVFTYTNGEAIAACALLYEITHEEEYMTLAIHIAWKSMRRDGFVEENGVLTEKGAYGPGKHDPAKNNDAVGFKSVLIRQLVTLYSVIQRTEYRDPEAKQVVAMIRQFININFQSQQERNTDGNGQYGPWWNGPFVVPTSHSQLAVLDVMAAAILVNK